MFHGGYRGVAAEKNVRWRCAKIGCHGLELVFRFRQLRQRLRQLAAVDADALPEVGIGARDETGHGPTRAALTPRACGRIEYRIPETDHRLRAFVLVAKQPQRLQARHRGKNSDGLAFDQPGRITIGLQVVDIGDRRGLVGHKQMER